MSLRRKAGRADGVQSELDDLQRKYRMMEVSRKTYNEDSQNTIRMQRQQIDKLKKDNDRLKEELALETRQARSANNVTSSAQIAKLQDLGDKYARKITVERRRIEELNKQIRRMEATILHQRKEMGGINASRENNEQVQKQIRILENRLDKALVKFNEALAHNKQLRETIDNLRRERVVFDGIYKKLERELHEKKNKMAEIIEISNSAYEARDAAQAEMIALKAQADKEQADFEAKWAQLGQLIEKDRKMKDFISVKERERGAGTGPGEGGAGPSDGNAGGSNGSGSGSDATKERALLAYRGIGGAGANGGGADGSGAAAGGAGGGDGSAAAADPALEEEKKLRKRVNKGAGGSAKDKANIHMSMEKVQSYEEAFAKIQQETGISDIDQLVETFIHAEDQNFALFNEVNDLSNQIEKIEEHTQELQDEIAKYQGQGENTDGQRKRILDDLQTRLERTRSKAGFYERKHGEAMETVNSLKAGIQSIFQKTGCDDSAVSEMLGTAGVTESNMMQYLGIIEQRTNELLDIYANQQAEEAAQSSEQSPQQPRITQNGDAGGADANQQPDEQGTDSGKNGGNANSGYEAPTIELPSMPEDDGDESDGQDAVPYSLDELKRSAGLSA